MTASKHESRGFPTNDEAAWLCSHYPDTGTYLLSLRPHEGIAWLKAACVANRSTEDKADEGRHWSNLGLAYADIGKSREAIKAHGEHLTIVRELEAFRLFTQNTDSTFCEEYKISLKASWAYEFCCPTPIQERLTIFKESGP